MNKSYLPIGSVCKLSTSPKEVMVIGYLPITKNEKGVMYDYSGCTYPEGLLSNDLVIAFNKSDIIEVIHNGLETEAYQNYINILNQAISEEKNI